MFKAIIWDFDGTICDTYPAIARAVNAALGAFGASASLERVSEFASISLDGCIRALAEEYAIPYEKLNAVFTVTYREVKPIDQPPFPGVVDLCQQLVDKGIQNFIVTHRRRSSLYTLLNTHALLPLFVQVIDADHGFAKKPAPNAYLHLLTTYAINPLDALVIGDRELDILAGQAAAIPTCLFRSSFAGITPTYSINSYGELAELLFGGESQYPVT